MHRRHVGTHMFFCQMAPPSQSHARRCSYTHTHTHTHLEINHDSNVNGGQCSCGNCGQTGIECASRRSIPQLATKVLDILMKVFASVMEYLASWLDQTG